MIEVRRNHDALMNGLKPIFPTGIDTLNDMVRQLNPLSREDLEWVGRQIPGFFRFGTNQTSDGGFWMGITFAAWDQSYVTVLFPIDDPLAGHVHLDRSIAMYGAANEGLLSAYLTMLYSEFLKLRIMKKKTH